MLRPAGGVLLCLLASASNCCDQSSAESSEASTASPAAAQSGSREHSSASILAELPAWKFESAFELLEVPEPSGLCYHPGRNTLFIVDDGCFGRRSAIFEIDLQANVLAKAELCAGVEGIAYCDLEGVCYCEADGMLYVCDENGERVFIVNPEGLELVGWFQVSRFFEGKEVLRARGNGFEGIEYIPVDAARSGLREPYKPGGGYFLLLNQDDPHCVVRIDLEDIDLSPDAAPVPLSGFWEIASINAGELHYDQQAGELWVVHSWMNVMEMLDIETMEVLRWEVIPGSAQEAVAIDGQGRLWIGADSGGIARYVREQPD